MSKILLVDIDTGMQNVFREMLREHSGQVEIMTSGNIKEVPTIIGSVKVNMIIVDLKMPDFEDFEFLTLMDQQHPHIPLIVTTAFGTPDIESRIRRFQSCLYLEKPVDMGMLREKIFDELNLGVGGQIHGIGLSSFLQMSEMEKTTCTLRITADEKVGLLYLLKGELIAADTGLLSGKEAAFEIVGWENAIIEIEKGAVKKKKEITMPLMNILMEALSIKDEKENERRGEKDKGKGAQKKKKGTADDSLEIDPDEETEQKPSKGSPKKKMELPGGKDGKLLSASQSLRRKRVIVTTYTTILIVVLSAAGWFSWFDFIKPRMIKKKYDDVLISIGYQESLDEKYYILEHYVENNPESPFFLGAEKKMEEIKSLILENDYKRAITGVESLPIDDEYNGKAKILYNEYLEKHPDGPHVEEIKYKISEIEKVMDEKRFADIKKTPSNQYEKRLQALNEYLLKHPEGQYRKEVKDLKKKQAESYYNIVKKKITGCEKDRDLSPCIELCSKFIDEYEESPRIPQIKALMASMQASQAMAALKKRVEDEKLDAEAAKEVYFEYLEKNTGKEVEKSIQAVLVKLDKKIKNKEAWEKIYSNSRNTKIDVDKRIRSVEKYMTKESSKQYKSSAKKIIALLEKEKQGIIKKELLAKERKRKEQERLRKIREEKERLTAEKKKTASALESLGKGRYKVNDDGTVSDMETGLLWNILDTHIELRKCLTYGEAKAYVEHMETGGYTDWRLPTAHDLLMLLNTEPGFHETGARRYWTSESYVKGFHDIANTIERTTDDTWRKSGSKLVECGAVRAVRP
jgi:CheY-like chemotaxis protein